MLKKHLLALITSLTFLFTTGCTEVTLETSGYEHIDKTIENNESFEQPNERKYLEGNRNGPVLSTMEVHYIDVGQADSTLVQYSDNGEEFTILIDAGNFNNIDVIDYLRFQQINQIDIAIGTHPDADHIGQLDQILNKYDVGEVWLSGNTSTSDTFQEVIAAIDSKGVDYNEPRMGEEYNIGPLEIKILYPKTISGETNGESISFKMTYGDVEFIFTGDATQENELEMINSGADLEADILQLGHHGSNTSTNPSFLKAVTPEVAIYSAGEDNKYGHPHSEVVNLIENSGIKLYGTDVHGTIIVTTDGNDYSIKTKEAVLTEHKESTSKTDTNSSCININSASVERIQEIIHMGPERAQDLVNLRPFQSVDDLTRIDGIGPARINDMKEEGLACTGG